MLLGSLPTEYENFIVTMESRDVFPKLESLKRKLIKEETRQSELLRSVIQAIMRDCLRIVPIENKPR